MKKNIKIAGIIAVIGLFALVFAACDTGTNAEKWEDITDPAQLYGLWKGHYSIDDFNEIGDFGETLESLMGEEDPSYADFFKNITIGGDFEIILDISEDSEVPPDPEMLEITFSGTAKITLSGSMKDENFSMMVLFLSMMAQDPEYFDENDMTIEFYDGKKLIAPGNTLAILTKTTKISIEMPLPPETQAVGFDEFTGSGVKINKSNTKLWLPADSDYPNIKGLELVLQS